MKFFDLFKHPGQGIIKDLKARAPYYLSDWKDAYNYRVIPSTLFMYFANILPALAFAQDMFDGTDNKFGPNEVLLSSAIAALTFGLFGHSLVIVGVTGPISIFNSTIYKIVQPLGISYFPFMTWVCLWSMVMHLIIAIFNWVNALRYVTKFSCDIFGFFICIIYIEKGIQLLTRQFDTLEAGYLSITVALLMLVFGLIAQFIGTSKLFNTNIRKIFSDYGTPLCVVFFSGFVHFGHRLGSTHLMNLPTTKSFSPTDADRDEQWFIKFWEISVGDVFLALPFGLLLTILFYFDHCVSALICQGSDFPLKKPSAFHWEFFLLGITTGVAGLIGIPAPNGLIPQAPLHTQSLCVVKTRGEGRKSEQYISEVVEQRFTNTVHGLMMLGTMSGPLLVVLSCVPQAVLAGLFWIMGITGLLGNTITERLYFIFGDCRFVDPENPLLQVKKLSLYIFIGLELLGAGAEVGVSQAVSAIAFPAVLLAFAVVGHYMYMIIPLKDVKVLDGPQGSDFILQNLVTKDSSNNEQEVDNEDKDKDRLESGVYTTQTHRESAAVSRTSSSSSHTHTHEPPHQQ